MAMQNGADVYKMQVKVVALLFLTWFEGVLLHSGLQTVSYLHAVVGVSQSYIELHVYTSNRNVVVFYYI